MRKRKVTDRHGKIGKMKVVKDFLPAPEMLVLREVNVKAPRRNRKREK